MFQLCKVVALLDAGHCKVTSPHTNVIMCRKEHDWHGGCNCFDSFSRFQAAHDRHADIEYGQIEVLSLGETCCLLPVASKKDPVSVVFKLQLTELANVLVVIGEENAFHAAAFFETSPCDGQRSME